MTLTEGAFLAGLTKGPSYYNPDRHRDRAQERLAYVLGRMQDDGVITDAQLKDAQAERLDIATLSRPRRDTGFHIVDQLGREARHRRRHRALTDTVLRGALDHPPAIAAAPRRRRCRTGSPIRAERRPDRVPRRRDQPRRSDPKTAADPNADRAKPVWQLALSEFRLPLYDVQWTPAVVVEKRHAEGRLRIDPGRIARRPRPAALDLFQPTPGARLAVERRDLRQRRPRGSGKQDGTRVEMRMRPVVQGAAVVLENRTGRILAMAGGFSYPLSQLNRVTQSRRQPGSSFKPIIYLAALNPACNPTPAER